MVEVVCVNKNNEKRCFPSGITLSEIIKEWNIETSYPILGALVNNNLKGLDYEVYTNRVICFVDASDTYGYAMYERSLCFLLYKAVQSIYPEEDIVIKHSISGGKFCVFENSDFELNDEMLLLIESKMKELVAADLPFIRKDMLTDEAVALYKENSMMDKVRLLQDRKVFYTSVYELDKTKNYFFGCLVPSTSYLTHFDLMKYENGFLLRTPSRHMPTKISPPRKSPKLFNIFREHKQWNELLGVSYVGDLNEVIKEGRATSLILLAEALHEKRLIAIADDIQSRQNVKMVLISGPSSSGKTTSCRRISVQLGVLGYQPVQLSVDNYFVERDKTPLDEQGNLDFEHIEAIDLQLFNDHLNDLVARKEVEIPTFDFQQGKKVWKGNKLKMGEKSILVVEGIHCLNPLLTQSVAPNLSYKLFVSALTSLAMDKHNPIHTNDNRLIRRIVRDYNYRGYSAADSLSRWNSVRKGEERWIFPFQENADAMFNSAMLCELSLLKKYANPILEQVPENVPEYAEAVRLKKLLSYFMEIDDQDVPHFSILREFFGGSVFKY